MNKVGGRSISYVDALTTYSEIPSPGFWLPPPFPSSTAPDAAVPLLSQPTCHQSTLVLHAPWPSPNLGLVIVNHKDASLKCEYTYIVNVCIMS